MATLSKYPELELHERLVIIRAQWKLALMAQGREVPASVDAEAVAVAYALEIIPTDYLEECLQLAIQQQTDAFPLTAGAVKTVWEWQVKREVQEREEARKTMLQLAPPRVEDMNIPDFKALHNLPDSWHLGQPYPPESDLYRSPLPVSQAKIENVFPAGPELQSDSKWHSRRKLPWELYPNAEHPKVSVVRIKKTVRPDDLLGFIGDKVGWVGTEYEDIEYRWWVDRCVEMDHPANVCPGYILEHMGPGGTWENKRPCPFHVSRWNGV